MTKLMVGRTAISGINLVLSHAGKAMRIACFPFLLLVISEFAYNSFYEVADSASAVTAADADGATEHAAGGAADDQVVVALGQFWLAVDWKKTGLHLVSTLGYVLLTVG